MLGSFLLDLPDPSDRALSALDGSALARCQTVCIALHARCGNDILWRHLVLREWAWLVQTLPPGRTWKWLFVRLAASARGRFCTTAGLTSPTARLCIVGRSTLGEGGRARAYLVATGSWEDMPPPAEQRNMAAVVRDSSGGFMVIGGLNDGEDRLASRTVECYQYSQSPQAIATITHAAHSSSRWLPKASMNVARCCCSAAIDARAKIYVVGGGENMYRNARALGSVEVYSEEGLTGLGSWQMGPAMCDARCGVGVAYSHCTDHLFAAGGYAGGIAYLDTAERLDLSAGSRGTWERLPPMSCQRAGPNAATAPDGRIFVLGGGPDGQREHNTMEAFDFREGRWQTSFAHMGVGRHYGAAAFGPDGCLYAAGSFRHTGYLDVVERYDLRTDVWELLPSIGAQIEFVAGTFVF